MFGRACFAGSTFEGPADFSNAKFGNSAEFSDTKFGQRTNFSGATFGHSTNFTRAGIGEWTTFAGATFGDFADFSKATFEGSVRFVRAVFGDDAKFSGEFYGTAEFTGAAFGWAGNFAGACFYGIAEFTGVAFGDLANFTQARFSERAQFEGMSEDQWTNHRAGLGGMDGEAMVALEKRHKKLWQTNGSRPDRFLRISFARARFDGEADFSRRSFEEEADFTNARFYYAPDFDAATKGARIDFTGAHIGFVSPSRFFHWTSDSKVPLRLRAFRKIAEDTKNHDLERDLYIEERKAERGVYWHQLVEELKKAPEELKKKLEDINKQKKHVWLEWRLQRRARNAYRLGIAVKIVRLAVRGLWIAVMGVYWALANYGRSFLLPAALLGLSVPLFYWGYDKILAPLMPQAGTLDAAKYARAEWMVALGNAVPFVGPLTIDAEIKKFLFCLHDKDCLPISPEGFQCLVIFQNVLSIILVFFIGLALRNYFRIK